MKIRNGFVSNSSSSSFTFIHKGDDIEELYKQIRKWNQYFELKGEGANCEVITTNAESVIEKIKTIDKNQVTYSIEDYINNLKRHQKELDECIKRRKEKDYDDYIYEVYSEQSWELSNIIFDVERLEKNGFKTVHVIGFGDNHGHIYGDNVGWLMDYEGRYIKINKENFVVFTEQNR